MGLKETPPAGYVAVRNTSDTQEQALYKHTLCLRYEPRSVATTAITNLMLCKDDSHRENMFTLVGFVFNQIKFFINLKNFFYSEMNGIKFAYKTTTLTPTTKPRRTAPEPPNNQQITTSNQKPLTSIIAKKVVSS